MSGSIRSNPLGVADDVRTARLIACAEAAELAEWLPKESGRRLVNLTRGVRKALTAGDEALAVRMMVEVASFAADSTIDPTLREALGKHVLEVLQVHKAAVRAALVLASGEVRMVARQLGLMPVAAKGDPA